MAADLVSITIRHPSIEVAAVDRLIKSGYAVNRTDYIRRAVREQIRRDAEDMKVWENEPR